MHRTQFTPLALAALLIAAAGCASATAPDVEVGEAAPVSSAAAPVTGNALTSAEEQTVLDLIDGICGDTWCDGDYDFRFSRLTCNGPAATCTLTLQIFPRPGVPATERVYFRRCTTAGFSGFDSLVTTAPNGYESLDQDYYMALTECISRLEEQLP